jgi:hypothetical protein
VTYSAKKLNADRRAMLRRVYDDLKVLSTSEVPGVAASARAALAQIASALNGEGLAYELYSRDWKSE